MASPDDDLAALRRRIDDVDDEILALLHRRAAIAREVAAWKAQHAARVWAPDRERQLLERLERASAGPFPTEGIRPVFREIISACLSLEKRLQVAYVGPEATFTHQAARSRFGLGAVYQPAATIAAALADVERGASDVAVVPVETAAEGALASAYEAIAETQLSIVLEIEMEAEPVLLARGAIAEAKKVYGHPQLLAACRGYLAEHLAQATPLEVASTALAARLARDEAKAAALGTELAGALYDLKVAARAAFDRGPAPSRYFVVGKGPSPAPSGSDRTSLIVAVRDTPGGLRAAIAPFERAGVNLPRVESRPPREAPHAAWERGYAFVDADGHVDEAPLAQALRELSDEGALVRVLGSYNRQSGPRALETASENP